MARPRAPFLYTETRLNLDQGHAGSTVDITLPKSTTNPSIFSNSLPAKRSVVSDIQVGADESTFAREHLATDASVYFRRDERYPRSFLWRLLDDRKALEIQSVDLSEDENEKTEALLTLVLRFPAAIRPFCIGFADPDERDALNVFAITTTNELWTLTLQKDFFVHLKTTEALTMEWCKVSEPSLFVSAKPYRMFASSSRELFVSLEDGSVVRLTRTAGDNGSKWHESKFQEGHWTLSLSRTITWRSRKLTEFGDLALDPTAVLCAASSGFDGDEAHLVTICLNHMLRIWDMKTGKILAEVDILGEGEELRETRYLTGPSQRQLLQILDMPGRDKHYYVVTYSPKEHRFRFWEIQNACSGSECIRLMREDINFTPPIDRLMDTAVWNLEEFYLSRGKAQSELWIRVRSGPTSQIFTVKFHPFDFDERKHDSKDEIVEQAWTNNWISVAHGQQTIEALDAAMPRNVSEDSSDVEIVNISDQWLTALFYPGRFSVPTLETALEVYSKARDYVSSSRASKASLKDRLTKAVKASSGSNSRKVAEQWQTFYDLVRDLHKRRSDTISFAVDPCDRLPWVVFSDFVAPIRACNDLEQCEYNQDIADVDWNSALVPYRKPQPAEGEEPYDAKTEIGPLLRVAHCYRASLPPSMQDALHRSVLAEMLEESDLSVMDRFHTLQGQVGLGSIPGEDLDNFEDLVNDNGGYSMFQTRNFERVLQAMQEESSGRHIQELITRFGTRTMIRSAQEIIAINTSALLDLLVMVLILEGNYEPEDLANAIHEPPRGDDELMDLDDDPESEFQPARLFMKLAKGLRECAVLKFMTSNLRQEQRKRRRRSTADSPAIHMMSASTVPTEPTYSLTLLESMFIGDWPDIKAPDNMPTQELITYMCGAWLTKLKIDQYDNFSAYVLADLIKHGDLRLANEFLPYVPKTGWSTYLRGRLSIATGNADDAAQRFREAAFPMGLSFFNVNSSDTAELLRPDEHIFFSDGLSPFYDHVMTLLASVKANTHVVEFANLALQAHAQQRPEPKGLGSEPDKKEMDEYFKRKSGIVNSLFKAALSISNFEEAYSALNRLPTPLRHFSLSTFINALIDQNRVTLLLEFPWTTLAAEADEVLVGLTKNKVLNIGNKPEYHKILYAWRVKRGDWRGAAQVAFDRLERLKASSEKTRDPSDERLVEAYLLLINSLACVAPEEAWVIKEAQADLANGLDGRASRTNGTKVNGHSGKMIGGSKRCVVSIEDVRREYQAELDRLAQLEQGDFAFSGEDGVEAMDVL